MSTPYKLTLINESERFGDFCVYATCPEAKDLSFDLHSLAWLCREVHPDTKVVFDWSLDFNFMWSETGELVPGVNFVASQILEADPSNPTKNRAFFDRQKNAYLFGPREEADAPKDGGLNISTSENIPNGRASIGIGIGRKPALATNATANYNFTFIPKIKYWVAFGTFDVGEVLDLNSMTRQVFEISYQPSEFEKTIVLGKDNRWISRSIGH